MIFMQYAAAPLLGVFRGDVGGEEFGVEAAGLHARIVEVTARVPRAEVEGLIHELGGSVGVRVDGDAARRLGGIERKCEAEYGERDSKRSMHRALGCVPRRAGAVNPSGEPPRNSQAALFA